MQRGPHHSPLRPGNRLSPHREGPAGSGAPAGGTGVAQLLAGAAGAAASAEMLRQREADVQRLSRLNEELMAQCDSYAQRLAGAEVEAGHDVEELSQQLQAATARVHKLESDLASARSGIAAAAGRRASHTHTHRPGSASAASSTRTASAAHPSHVALHVDADRLLELQAALIQADAEVQAQVRARAELESSLRAQVEQLRVTTRNLAAAEARLAERERGLKRAEADAGSLGTRLTALRTRNEQLEKQATALQAKLTAAEVALSERAAAADALAHVRRQVGALQDLLRDAKEQVHAARGATERAAALERDKTLLLAEAAALRARAADAEDRLGSAQGEAIEARTESVVLKARLSAVESENASLQGQLGGAQSQVAAMRQELVRAAARAEAEQHAQSEQQRQQQHQQGQSASAHHQQHPQRPQHGEPGALQAEVARLHDALRGERLAHEEQLREVEATVSHLAEEQALVEDTLRRLHSDNAELRTRLAASAAERDAAMRLVNVISGPGATDAAPEGIARGSPGRGGSSALARGGGQGQAGGGYGEAEAGPAWQQQVQQQQYAPAASAPTGSQHAYSREGSQWTASSGFVGTSGQRLTANQLPYAASSASQMKDARDARPGAEAIGASRGGGGNGSPGGKARNDLSALQREHVTRVPGQRRPSFELRSTMAGGLERESDAAAAGHAFDNASAGEFGAVGRAEEQSPALAAAMDFLRRAGR
jgi:chromosome segregation ATPase